MLQGTPPPRGLSPADAIPVLGGLITLVVGHVLNKRRAAVETRQANRRKSQERRRERRDQEYADRLSECNRLKEEVQLWRDRAQSYRIEVLALRALNPSSSRLVERTDDKPFPHEE